MVVLLGTAVPAEILHFVSVLTLSRIGLSQASIPAECLRESIDRGILKILLRADLV